MVDRREHFKRGTLKNIILVVLNSGPKGVYDIKKTIKDLSFGFYVPSTGVIYPNLKVLLKEGYIKEIYIDKRKKYALTEEGKKFMESNFNKWKEMFENKRKKFEKMGETGNLLRVIMEKIITMDDEKFNKNQEKILKILRETIEKIDSI